MKLEDIDDKTKRLIFQDNVAAVRAEPSYISFLNSEEIRLIEMVIGVNWKTDIHKWSGLELEDKFYTTFPNCPDLRDLGVHLF